MNAQSPIVADAPLLDPMRVTVPDRKGRPKDFIISEIPCIPSREILMQYPVSALPKLGDYIVNEKMCLRMLSYVDVVLDDGGTQRLKTETLILNHCDVMQLMKLEGLMFQHNYGFFLQGTISGFSSLIEAKVPQWISKISTILSGLSFQKDKPV